MGWNYSGNPASSTRDAVRFLIGDTDEANQMLQDEEIEYVLTQYTNMYAAAALCCDTIAARYAKYTDKRVGDLSISYGQKATQYSELAKKLRVQASIKAAPPWCGSISIASKDAEETDTDRVAPNFALKMHDFETTDLDELAED